MSSGSQGHSYSNLVAKDNARVHNGDQLQTGDGDVVHNGDSTQFGHRIHHGDSVHNGHNYSGNFFISHGQDNGLFRAAQEGLDAWGQPLPTARMKPDSSERDNEIILHSAAEIGSTTSVQQLLGAGVNVNCQISGETALIAAARGKQSSTVKILLDHGADVDARGKFGVTALKLAISNTDVPTFDLLLGRKPNLEALDPDSLRITPLMDAAEYWEFDFVQKLLDAGASVNAKDMSGKSALGYARGGLSFTRTRAAQKATIEVLLAYNAV